MTSPAVVGVPPTTSFGVRLHLKVALTGAHIKIVFPCFGSYS